MGGQNRIGLMADLVSCVQIVWSLAVVVVVAVAAAAATVAATYCVCAYQFDKW